MTQEEQHDLEERIAHAIAAYQLEQIAVAYEEASERFYQVRDIMAVAVANIVDEVSDGDERSGVRAMARRLGWSRTVLTRLDNRGQKLKEKGKNK